MNEQMHRYRFHANEHDWRPVTFPPPGPYWCTGYGDGYATLVAWVPKGQVQAYWPEATEIDDMGAQPIFFTDRMPKPDWWQAREVTHE